MIGTEAQKVECIHQLFIIASFFEFYKHTKKNKCYKVLQQHAAQLFINLELSINSLLREKKEKTKDIISRWNNNSSQTPFSFKPNTIHQSHDLVNKIYLYSKID